MRFVLRENGDDIFSVCVFENVYRVLILGLWEESSPHPIPCLRYGG